MIKQTVTIKGRANINGHQTIRSGFPTMADDIPRVKQSGKIKAS